MRSISNLGGNPGGESRSSQFRPGACNLQLRRGAARSGGIGL